MSAGELGQHLASFHAAARRFREELDADPPTCAALFSGAGEWLDLLRYKLLPHFGDEGCLVVAVAGGTNTGKSTIFNALLGEDTSPVRYTAAATCRPVLAANAARAQQCLEGRLLREFNAVPMESADAALNREADENALYVAQRDRLPDRVVLLDTPDVDSIDTANWEVADHLRAAGDIVIAVLTGEKYKDERVVKFFREAHAAGRVVLPLMNKANPADQFAIARTQLEEFCRDAGLGAPPCFVMAHDFNIHGASAPPVAGIDGGGTLWAHVESLEVAETKARVYGGTVAHFNALAAAFIANADAQAVALRQVVAEYEARAASFATRYDPTPGAKVGGLFHSFVQSKRGPIDRAIGAASRQATRALSVLGRAISRMASNAPARANAEEPDARLRDHHAMVLERLAREFAALCIDGARSHAEPAGRLLAGRMEAMDLEAAATDVARRTLAEDDLSEAFRAHAERQLEAWWNDHAGRRNAILAIDRTLAVAPAGIAAWFALHTAGIGLAETLLVAGPVMEQFAARVVEYQFGDQMFNFVAPWRVEQQAALKRALVECIARPALAPVGALLAAFEGDAFAEMKRAHAACVEAQDAV